MKLSLDANDRPRFTFCESVAAGSRSRWHIREIPAGEAPKFGGGITTPSLCRRVERGWDLEVVITEHHLGHACAECVDEYRARDGRTM